MFFNILVVLSYTVKKGATMNKIWGFLMIFSICMSIFSNSPNVIMTNIKLTTNETVKIVFNIVGIMCFWNGIFNILRNTKLLMYVSKLFKPVTKMICGKNENISEEIKNNMILNFSANFLGVGNAATMSGIKVMKGLDEINNSEYPSDVMKKFVLINTASIQVLPTTILTLRSTYNSKNPSIIIGYVWIISVLSLLVGFLLINVIKERRDE